MIRKNGQTSLNIKVELKAAAGHMSGPGVEGSGAGAGGPGTGAGDPGAEAGAGGQGEEEGDAGAGAGGPGARGGGMSYFVVHVSTKMLFKTFQLFR